MSQESLEFCFDATDVLDELANVGKVKLERSELEQIIRAIASSEPVREAICEAIHQEYEYIKLKKELAQGK